MRPANGRQRSKIELVRVKAGLLYQPLPQCIQTQQLGLHLADS